MPLPDYYAMLEVSADATQTEIKRSYRRLARQYHPDLNAALDEHIKQLNQAYQVLGNSSKRAAYDGQRLRAEQLRRKAQAEREELLRREARMSWVEGIFGFVRELRKALRED